jgi:hypothetical protein
MSKVVHHSLCSYVVYFAMTLAALLEQGYHPHHDVKYRNQGKPEASVF